MESSGLPQKVFGLVLGLQGIHAYIVILAILFACGIGVPIPEDITLIAAGVLASQGSISLVGGIIAGFVGVLVGDVILFFIGRKFGRKAFQWPGFRRVFTPERILTSEQKIRENAFAICFWARFAPGLRAPTYLTAGVMGVRFRTFFFADSLAAVWSAPMWVYVGYFFGTNLDDAVKFARRFNVALIVVLVIAVAFFLYRRRRRKTL